MNKLLLNIVICSLFLCQIAVASITYHPAYSLNINDSEIINEYTWSIMRYDHVCDSRNFGIVEMPKPSPGTTLIPTNMMNYEICRIAVTIFDDDKMNILESLEEYDLENMVVGFPYLFWLMFSSTNSFPAYQQKASANEMKLFGDTIFWANFVGDCYSQSMFNTAVLRLCGFSPEEVFTVLVPMHAFTIVQVDEQWYVFDSQVAQLSNNAIYDAYSPNGNMIYWLENDKYLINFGTPYPESWPYMTNPLSNIEPTKLTSIVEDIVPLLNYSKLGENDWEIHDFIENASPSMDMSTIGIPYYVNDAVGITNEEKTLSLLSLNKAFILNQTDGEVPNQYDRCLYAFGELSVEFPQAYANAAKYGSWTSWFGNKIDSNQPSQDIQRAVMWINYIIKTKQISIKNNVYFSDFTYRIKKGSTIDKSIVAYGTLRNMKKDANLWQPEDLFVLITEDNVGYLGVNIDDNWNYLNFENGDLVTEDEPNNVILAFNEEIKQDDWL